MDNMRFEPTRDKTLIGVAGVHFVVSELSLRGLIALPTIRNTAGIDIVAAKKNGIWHANLQIKTSRGNVKFWPISKNWESWKGPNNFYVFVRYLEKIQRFEAFLEPSDKVIEQRKGRDAKKIKPNPFPCWHLLKTEAERVQRQWMEFPEDSAV